MQKIPLTATATVKRQALATGTKTVVLINDGAGDCYFTLLCDGEPDADPVDGAATDAPIKAGESLTFVANPNSSQVGHWWRTFNYVCGAGTSLRIFAV